MRGNYRKITVIAILLFWQVATEHGSGWMMTVTLVDDYRDNATMTLTMPTMMTTTTIITKYIVEPSAIVVHKGTKREREVTWLMAAESSL